METKRRENQNAHAQNSKDRTRNAYNEGLGDGRRETSKGRMANEEKGGGGKGIR